MKPVNLSSNVKENVANLLTISESSQYSDAKLMANYWYHELQELGYSKDFAVEFCKVIAEEKITNSETIRRHRQKLQEENPSIYGFNKTRNKKQEQIKKQLKHET